jgi:hypothetical protein
VLLRDYGVGLRAGSAGWELEARLTLKHFADGRPLGRELEYVLSDEPTAAEGSYVELTGADQALMRLFARASELFHHATNPRLSRPIWVDWERGVGIYHAANARRGEVYYRRQLRGALSFAQGSGLSVAYDERIASLEGDRDRRKLRSPQRVLHAALSAAPDEVLRGLLWRLRRSWKGGGAALRTLVKVARERKLQVEFPERWVAGSRAYGDKPLVELAERRGYRVAIPELAEVGMAPLRTRLGQARVLREPRAWERSRWEIAASLYESLSGSPPPIRRFKVLELPKSLSEISYGSHTAVVYLEELDAPFESGVCSLMVSMGMLGGPNKSSNADRITALLDGTLGRHEGIAAARVRWDAVAVSAEGSGEAAALEVDVASAPMDGVLEVAILGPAGWWACEQIEAQIRELCARKGTPFVLRHVAVQDERGAKVEGARGVPSVWIGSVEVGGAKGGRLGRYKVRRYDSAGEAPYIPSAQLLEEALRREVMGAERRQWRGRRWLAMDAMIDWQYKIIIQPKFHRSEEQKARDQALSDGYEQAKEIRRDHKREGSERWKGLEDQLFTELRSWLLDVGEEEARARYARWVGGELDRLEARLEAWRGETQWVSARLGELIVAGAGVGDDQWETRLEQTLRRAEPLRELMSGYQALGRQLYGAAVIERLEGSLGRRWEAGEEGLAEALAGELARMQEAMRELEGIPERHHVVVRRRLARALGVEETWADPWGDVAEAVRALGREASAEEVLAEAQRVWQAYPERERLEHHLREGYRWGAGEHMIF